MEVTIATIDANNKVIIENTDIERGNVPDSTDDYEYKNLVSNIKSICDMSNFDRIQKINEIQRLINQVPLPMVDFREHGDKYIAHVIQSDTVYITFYSNSYDDATKPVQLSIVPPNDFDGNFERYDYCYKYVGGKYKERLNC